MIPASTSNIPADLQVTSSLAWLVGNSIANENGAPMEWYDHRFLIEPMLDMAPNQATMKCSQIGYSTLAILKEIHLARYWGANIIHTLPTKTITKDFVTPKVDKIIARNPAIKEFMGQTDSINLKAVGDRFIYYRGTFDESQAIAISAHVLIQDEFDRSKQDVLELYKTRLGDARRERPDLGFVWSFSNPSMPGFGIHDLYQKSDQKIWMVRCGDCKHYQEMTWPESVDLKKKTFICRICEAELSDDDRRFGKWVPQFPGRPISGYHISRLIVPWTTAEEVVDASQGDIGLFYNFWLGLPWVDPDIQITRESIVRAIVLTENPKTGVVIGVDNGVEKHYVIGNQYGIFDYGVTKDWQVIENLHNQYNAITVIDANPHPNQPTKLVKKYPNRVFMHWFSEDTKNLGIIRWGQGPDVGRVLVDRTRMLDLTADEINHQEISFNLGLAALEGLIAHCEVVYRIVAEDAKGRPKGEWMTQGSKPDHWWFAINLWRVGMNKRKESVGAGPVSMRKKETFPKSFAIDTYGFGDKMEPHSPGYDINALKKRLSTKPKRGQDTKIFRPKQS